MINSKTTRTALKVAKELSPILDWCKVGLELFSIAGPNILQDLKKLGYNVLTPYGDCERYDYVVDAGNKFYRVQSKTSHSKDNGASFVFSGRSCHRKGGKIIHHQYTNKEIDYFVTSFNGKCYLIPVEECGSNKNLRILPTTNGQERGVTLAKDYELEEVVKRWS